MARSKCPFGIAVAELRAKLAGANMRIPLQVTISVHPGELEVAMMALGYPDDPERREAYRVFLAERGDARAELFSVAAALGGTSLDGTERAKLAARFDALLASPERRVFWEAFSHASPIRNCGGPSDEPRSVGAVRFAFECPKVWETLESTDTSGVRACGACQELVYLCTSREEAERRAREGLCISVPVALANGIVKELSSHVTGRPDPAALWADSIFGEPRST